jgi:hypothetical protein
MNAQTRFFKEKVIVTRDEENVPERAERGVEAFTEILAFILNNNPQNAPELLRQLALIITQMLEQTQEQIQARERQFNFR